MKGVVFNLLEAVVRRDYGDDAWEALLDAAGTDGAYSSLGNYPDEELVKLVGAASSALKMPADDVVRWFGRNALPLLAKTHPHFFTAHKSTRPFLLTLNDVIHAEVRKLYPGADVPVFTYDTSSSDFLLMHYRSHRKLCALAEGFIQATAAYYAEELSLDQLECMNRGDDKCVLRVSVKKARG
ncbi:heme NO-binding domain-containing protein [Bradyrhizobium sp. BWC-3-1]|uniref:heme NO-binding domain-containing protein n=1 Tax=Bradyrhizobium sp. BWC-3-1 TaxID=3080012 RepID=UPI00293F096C|nr:heme NO-binding domain-containing protein [Bradyrhizobium sp. BWC-3-1]WOH60161.1 heme NO-binding domain-containing protein [Bradyrhizobium sp. BWC-3-1]